MACGGNCCGTSARSSTDFQEVVAEAIADNNIEGEQSVNRSITTNYAVQTEEGMNGHRSVTDEPAMVEPEVLEDADCNEFCCSTSVQRTSCKPKTLFGETTSSTTLTPTTKEACCGPNKASMPSSNTTQPATTCKASCCTDIVTSTEEMQCSPQDKRSDGCCETETPSCEDDCCGNEGSSCKDDCCSPSPPPSTDNCCISNSISASECCKTKTKPTALVDEIVTTSRSNSTPDLEKGPLTSPQHIVLSVTGMTCTGCETKLSRVLNTLPYIRNLRISLILGRAELDLFDTAATADDVIAHIHRTTTFTCTQILSSGGSHVDLLCADPLIVDSAWPSGISNISWVSKTTVSVSFDPHALGARDLLDSEWATSRNLQLAPPRTDNDASALHLRRMGLTTLLSALLTIPVLVLAWAPLAPRPIAYATASLVLATLVQVCVAGPFYPQALKALIFSRVVEMDLLIVLSTSAAYVFSVVAYAYLVSGRPLATGEFFETSTLLVTLIMVGRWVACLARNKAAESVSVGGLQSQTAVLVEEKGDREIDARLLQFGDVFRVGPDAKVPTDGVVLVGESEMDEAMLTGESVPVAKEKGDKVVAGSVNGWGVLRVRVTRLPGDNTISTIAGMVDQAKLEKPKIQDIADRVASYFVPVVVCLTVITFVTWLAIGMTVRRQSGSEAATEAITYAITVLIVSCPCAIGLAVPMVIVVATGVAAKRGVIFKSAHSIETAYKTTDVVFDKTGTLTSGVLSVVEEKYISEDPDFTKTLLLGLLTGINHPVSAAIATHLSSQTVLSTTVQNTKTIPGKGVQSTFQNKSLRAGNSRWLNLTAHPHIQPLLTRGLTTFCFTIDSTLVAAFGLQDTLRSDALDTVQRLHLRRVNVHILSGDDEGAVSAVAAQLNIPETNVRARCAPQDKQAYIKDLVDTASQRKVVLFVGDGTNDAVAIAQASIGVHVSSGAELARSAADVVLMRPDLSCVLTIMNVSRKAMRRVAFNFGWSFVYNLFAVLLGAGAFVDVRIPPEYAGLGELVSVLPVIGAAVALRWAKI